MEYNTSGENRFQYRQMQFIDSEKDRRRTAAGLCGLSIDRHFICLMRRAEKSRWGPIAWKNGNLSGKCIDKSVSVSIFRVLEVTTMM
jgi:hypothetical protein